LVLVSPRPRQYPKTEIKTEVSSHKYQVTRHKNYLKTALRQDTFAQDLTSSPNTEPSGTR